MGLDLNKKVTRVRVENEIMTRQKLPYYVGISKDTAGAEGISMNRVVIPPGGMAEPHYHKDFETAIYLLEGRVDTRYGKGLKESILTEKGDFLFIPPGVPHQPVNLSATEPAVAIVSRNDPNERENVVMYPAKDK
jgi:uncharacterized RmlC-like cupin family protein